ncbi:carboxypeptidase-like regulatory domain-containing protein [Chitinophaga filiformis]|uniref:carboxypeptidase-like regulatory domain-containing protein n=1 Tax=Chitinophaga filiformis TaxID=104663 RepID=UPI001F4649DB|nr:carboxypeptidase-like regulatory domain-containing protein [Chitinophaga filiformis]MCF6402300.1 carboxypeptidase-like regulatory domain-containing protein [Chitinophaga filiformis]
MRSVNVSIFALAVAAIAVFAFRNMDGGTISGKVTPLDGASMVWAISGTDSLKTDIADGTFTLQGAEAGTYTVVIDAKQPFKDVTISDVKVDEGKVTDLGEIKLEQ